MKKAVSAILIFGMLILTLACFVERRGPNKWHHDNRSEQGERHGNNPDNRR